MLRVTCGSVHRTSPHFTRYDTVHYTLLAGDSSIVVRDYSASTGQENCSRGISARVKRQDMLCCTTHQLSSRLVAVEESTRPLLIGL